MLNRLFRDKRGSAALEFALVAPIMLLLYFGMAEITQGLLANRRADHVASAVGDLVAQKASLTEADVEDIFNISTALLRPMPTTKLAMRVTSISIDATGKATVVWSRNRGTLAKLDDASLGTIKAGLIIPGESQALVRADTTYTYTSPLKDVLPNDIVFQHTTYLKPRGAAAVVIKP
jgi:Flp pilus assembly protein TadG